MATTLDLSALASAVETFDRVLTFVEKRELEDASDTEKEVLRAGIIQTFEYTYELCWKTMKRWLEMHLSPDETRGIPRREFYRICAENLLIDDVNAWFDFHEDRNLATHTYNEAIAEDVFATARRFLPYAKDCLNQLKARL